VHDELTVFITLDFKAVLMTKIPENTVFVDPSLDMRRMPTLDIKQ